jgi:hypothetical protein
MTKVEQRVYNLGTESGNKINETDNLLVAINDITSKITLKSLFESYKQGTSDIKGHSFLYEYPIEDGRIVISDSISINIVNKNDDQNIYFTSVKEPFIQGADVVTDKDGLLAILEAEMIRISPVVEREEEIIVQVDEPTVVGDIAEESEETKESTEETEESDSDEYSEFKKSVEDKGYKEFKSGKYCLLYNKDTKKGGLYLPSGEKVTYSKVSDDGSTIVLRAAGAEEDTIFIINS